jgi:hypothetical protein
VSGLGETLRVRGDVAGVADGDAEQVERSVEILEDLERRGLLPLQAELVDAVDERDRMPVTQLAHEL